MNAAFLYARPTCHNCGVHSVCDGVSNERGHVCISMCITQGQNVAMGNGGVKKNGEVNDAR